MNIFLLISALLLSNFLFAEDNGIKLNKYNSTSNFLMDTNGLDSKLKHFLYKYYQKNFSGNEYVKAVNSMHFFGSYSVNGEKVGTIKLIKKRPNKYKSHIKKKDGLEEIIVFDGKNFQKSEITDSDLPTDWQTIDVNATENLWIHYDQLFDSVLLYPNDPNKEISLGNAYAEDGQVIQPIKIDLRNQVQITHFISVRDNLMTRTFIEFHNPKDPDYYSYTIYYEDFELINGLLMPKKITTELSDETTIVTEFSDVQFNLGISDFFFEAISL